MILRGILTFSAALLLLYFVGAAHKRPAQKLGICFTFAMIGTFALYPEGSTVVAHWVGVGRGVDLVLYLSSFVLLTLSFSLYLGHRELGDQVTALARRLTLTEAYGQSQTHTKRGRQTQLEGESRGEESALDTFNRAEVNVVIPVYNEVEVIGSVVGDLLDAGYTVIAIDDGSLDGSSRRLSQLFEEGDREGARSRFHLLRHPINLGQGAALQTGFEYADILGGSYVVTFDADGQHRVEDLPPLIEALNIHDAEVALGSRFLGSTEGMPSTRRAVLKLAVLFTRWVGGIRVSDSHNGLRAFTLSTVSRLRLSQNRMAHASELLHLIKSLELKFVEVPVTILYTPRSLAKGQSLLGAVNIVFDLLIKRLFG